MLHYSNASSIEKNRRYLVIKGGGLAWKLSQEGEVINSIVGRGTSSGVGLVVYRRRGGRNKKYNANISMTMEDMSMRGARCALTR